MLNSTYPSMENPRNHQETENPSPLNSPNTNGTTTTNNNGGLMQIQTPPLTPPPISRSESNPYPTTFVQADTTTFKQVVQMLTGSTETVKQASSKTPAPAPAPGDPSPSSKSVIPPIKTLPKRQGFKLYERRNNHIKNNLIINTLAPNFVHNSSFSPRRSEILSPSLLDFPKLTLSPVTPLIIEGPIRSCSPSEEDKAIAQKGFYLHPSPMSTPRDSEPQLLPLFPLTSPRVSGE